MLRRLLFLSLLLLFAGCAPRAVPPTPARPAPSASSRPAAEAAAVESVVESSAEGLASWYGPGFVGRKTASGELFTSAEFTAAHKTLPFNTRVRVTNLANGRNVVVRINDRGPFKPGRVIDLSRVAAQRLDMVGSGVARVRLEVLDGGSSRPDGAGLALVAPVSQAPWQAAAWGTLTGYDAMSRFYEAGDLLFLTSPKVTDPVLVRVVASQPPAGTRADILLSPEAYALLGAAVSAAP